MPLVTTRRINCYPPATLVRPDEEAYYRRMYPHSVRDAQSADLDGPAAVAGREYLAQGAMVTEPEAQAPAPIERCDGDGSRTEPDA